MAGTAWQRGRIEVWLSQKLTLVRIHELLGREGIAASYTTMRRFAEKELGWRRRGADGARR